MWIVLYFNPNPNGEREGGRKGEGLQKATLLEGWAAGHLRSRETSDVLKILDVAEKHELPHFSI